MIVANWSGIDGTREFEPRRRAQSTTPAPAKRDWTVWYPNQCCRNGYCIEGPGVSMHELDITREEADTIVAAARRGSTAIDTDALADVIEEHSMIQLRLNHVDCYVCKRCGHEYGMPRPGTPQVADHLAQVVEGHLLALEVERG